MKADSPCVNICKLDERGACLGCCRTLDEIACWSRMNEREKAAVTAMLGSRRSNPEAVHDAMSNE